jgi:Alpha/beta hydrolase
VTLTVADIERWRAGDVREVFHAATSRAQAAFDAANGIATLPAFSSWGGEAAEAAQEAIGQTRKDLDAHGSEALAVANAARRAADDIEEIKSELTQLKADAEASGLEVDPYTNRIVPLPGSSHGRREMQSKIPALQARLGALVEKADSVDVALANAINMADDRTPVAATPHDNRPDVQAALNKPLPEDPKQFSDLWNKLTKEEKDWLYSQDHNLGNHPGMHFGGGADDPGKDYYNRIHLDELQQTTQADIDRMQARFGELAAKAYMGDHSSETTNEMNALAARVPAARHQLDGYHAVRGTLDTQDGVQRYLGLIDDQGHAAVSIGNPDTAKRTATFVPGTGQDAATFDGSNRKSLDMYQAALDADPALSKGDVSVTTWMGYDRPMDLTQAAFPGRAEDGGAALDGFVNGMHASHQGAPAIDTVIGHSYGSTLVGGAATDGNHLAADNVIAVGSPGMLTEHASALALDPGAHVYSMTARNDVIGLVTDMTLGADPFSNDYGATRLWADPGPPLPNSGGVLPSVAAHSSYWSENNPGLANMGSIIAGLPPAQIVTPEGMVTNP